MLVAGPADAYFYLSAVSDAHDELVDRDVTFVSIQGATESLDCSRAAAVTRDGNQFTSTFYTISGVSSHLPCPFGRHLAQLGMLPRGFYTVRADIVDAVTNNVVESREEEFYVRSYAASCNRYPNSGSILNVYLNGFDGTQIAQRIRGDGALAASLGNPVLALTLYMNSGVQLVYAAYQDPLPLYDAAVASGAFDNVGMIRGRDCLVGIPPPDLSGSLVEFHHGDADSYFYSTNQAEITGLDATSSFGGWSRTGKAFRVILGSCQERRPDLFQAYRFVAPNTHLFSIDQEECYAVAHSSGWQFEGVAFYAGRPTSDGSCPVDRQPVYRLWRPFGESRHRLSTDRDVVDDMQQRGWLLEGAVMCVPI